MQPSLHIMTFQGFRLIMKLLSIYNVLLVHVVQGEKELCCIEFRVILGQFLHFADKIEKLPSWTIIQSEIKIFVGLECVIQLNNKRVLYFQEDVFLQNRKVLLGFSLKQPFVYDFEGHRLFRGFEAGKHDLTVGTTANHTHHHKILYPYLFHYQYKSQFFHMILFFKFSRALTKHVDSKSQLQTQLTYLKNQPVKLAILLRSKGIPSRNAAQKLIRDGLIKVNGKIAHSQMVVSADSKITIKQSEPVLNKIQQSLKVWIFNKPRRCVCDMKDPLGRTTIFDILGRRGQMDLSGIIALGRLDYNSQGLMLLTNNQLIDESINSLRLQSVYRVRAFGQILQKKLDRIEDKGFSVKIQNLQNRNSWLTFKTSREYRDVRTILRNESLIMNRLVRISMGEYKLGSLDAGMVRQVELKGQLRRQIKLRLKQRLGS